MGGLTYQVVDSAETSFHKTAVVVAGGREAAIIDAGFTVTDGQRIAAAAEATGKPVTTIFVSAGDPDYYFGLQPVTAAFPRARVLSTPEIISHIRDTYLGKLATWRPYLGDNLPTDVAIPEPLEDDFFEVAGHRFVVAGATRQLPDHIYLWQPDTAAILGGVYLFAGLHVWTADTRHPDQRAGWRKQLQQMLDRDPRYVVAGHRAGDGPTDSSVISYTLRYLTDFEEAVARAPDATTAREALKDRYPDKGMPLAAELGTKVAKGEAQWS